MNRNQIIVLVLVALFAGFIGTQLANKDDKISLDAYLPDNKQEAAVEEDKAPETVTTTTTTVVSETVKKEPEPIKPTAKLVVYSDLPESVRGEFSEEEWAYIAPAIDKALAAGERKKAIEWTTPAGVSGQAYQSGTGADEDGCRQIRITKNEQVIYVEKCANGQFK